jgi:hypothetical protein
MAETTCCLCDDTCVVGCKTPCYLCDGFTLDGIEAICDSHTSDTCRLKWQLRRLVNVYSDESQRATLLNFISNLRTKKKPQ